MKKICTLFFLISLVLAMSSLKAQACYEMSYGLYENESNCQENEFQAAREFANSLLDLYAPDLKKSIELFEERIKNMMQFSGAIYLNKQKHLAPIFLGEVKFDGDDKKKKPFLSWSLRTAFNFNAGAIRLELWKDSGLGKVTFFNELEQEISDEINYKILIKLEKNF